MPERSNGLAWKVSVRDERTEGSNPSLSAISLAVFASIAMAASISPLATISCELRQARKGAAVAMISGAGVWRVEGATL